MYHTPVLSEVEYVEMNGEVCPYCASRAFAPVQSNKMKRTTALECNDCHGKWLERGHMEGPNFVIRGFIPINKNLDETVN